MPVQINEVVIRAIITGDDGSKKKETAPKDCSETIASVTKEELLELVDEVIKDKKER